MLSVSAFDQVHSGCGSACGRHGGNSTFGELESSSASSPSVGSQHSVSPVRKYNLRGTTTTVDGAAAVSDAADSVVFSTGFYFSLFFLLFFVVKRKRGCSVPLGGGPSKQRPPAAHSIEISFEQRPVIIDVML